MKRNDGDGENKNESVVATNGRNEAKNQKFI